MTIITTKQAAKLLHADVRTVQRNAKAGMYPTGVCGKHGRYYLFDEDALLNYIFSKKVA